MKIAILTTSRADYGLLKKLIYRINEDSECELCLIVSGSHVSPEFGATINLIDAPISAKVEVLISSDTNTAISKSIGLGCLSFSDVFENEKPDWLIVLGDRFEVLSAVIAAYCQGVPVAHISGGELTSGSLDDGFRHCITKLSYLHFAYTEEYRKRIIQLGEHPDRVFNVGHIGLEGIGKYYSKEKEDAYLVVWHPETFLSPLQQKRNIKTIMSFLPKLKEAKYFCYSKGDGGSRQINQIINNYIRTSIPYRNKIIDGNREGFLKVLARVKAIVGNSSAAIYEAPLLGTPAINIGARQDGRIKSAPILDCECSVGGLKEAFEKLNSEDFKKSIQNYDYPFRGGNVSKRILDRIKETKVVDLQKGFYDIP